MKFTPIYSYKSKDYAHHKIRLRGVKQNLKIKMPIKAQRFRLLFTNLYNSHRLRIKKVEIIINGNYYPITLNGKTKFSIKPFKEVYSDEIEIDEEDVVAILISVKFAFFNRAYTVSDFNSIKIHAVDHMDMFNSPKNIGLATKSISKPNLQLVALIKQVEAITELKSITWFGDSLTNHGHYTQPLQVRMHQDNKALTILNAGHSGNRLLRDGRHLMKNEFGISGLKRIQHDVFDFNQPDAVVVALGINDLIHPGSTVPQDELPTFEAMQAGYLDLLKQIKGHHAKAIICTITPFEGYKVSTLAAAEKIRQALNAWIRTQSDFDLVLDIDEVVKDPNNPKQLDSPYIGDDYLHWDALGGQMLADQIDLQSIYTLLDL